MISLVVSARTYPQFISLDETPCRQHHQLGATIILCDMRTVARAEHCNLLLYLCNIIISTLKINLRLARDPSRIIRIPP
jgi:hypothetical protein